MLQTVRHPAPFSDELIEPMAEMLRPHLPYIRRPQVGAPEGIYDPMAGSGKAARVADALGCRWWGCEIEPEFVPEDFRDRIIDGDCRDFSGIARCVVTSPAYGNRLADQYLGTPGERAKRAADGKNPRRRSYAISLGRRLTDGNGAALQWGAKYRVLHASIFTHVVFANLEPIHGLLLLNVASHFRAYRYQPVAEWYLELIVGLGMVLVDYRFVETKGFRDGQNREARVGGEHLFLFQKVVPR